MIFKREYSKVKNSRTMYHYGSYLKDFSHLLKFYKSTIKQSNTYDTTKLFSRIIISFLSNFQSL